MIFVWPDIQQKSKYLIELKITKLASRLPFFYELFSVVTVDYN